MTGVQTCALPIFRFLEYPRRPEENLFLLFGSRDQRFRMDRGTNLVEWQVGLPNEITDPEGLFILVDYSANDTRRQFFRAVTLP